MTGDNEVLSDVTSSLINESLTRLKNRINEGTPITWANKSKDSILGGDISTVPTQYMIPKEYKRIKLYFFEN